jgi:hypothetical protein
MATLDEEIRQEVHELIERRKNVSPMVAGLFAAALLATLVVYIGQELRVMKLQSQIQDLENQIAAYKTQKKDPGIRTYLNRKQGISLVVPGDWITMKENEKTEGNNILTTILQSPDYREAMSANLKPIAVNRGAKVIIWEQQPSSIKSIAEMITFLKSGREGYVQKSEQGITVGGEQALLYDMGGYQSGKLKEIYVLHRDRWINLTISYEETDPKYEQIYSNILNSVVFTD